MADFDDIRFPPRISMDAVGGPRFKTSVASMASGAEQRIAWWPNERGEWTVSYHARRPSDWQPMLAFFRAIAQGRANTFRFKDWTDYICENGEGTFAETQLGGPYQMVKLYTFGGYTYERVIRKPIEGKITTDAPDLDYATGLSEAGGTYWYGEFDVMARLDNDPARCQVIDRNVSEGLIVGWDGIEIVEVTGEVAEE